MFKTD